MVDRYDAAMAEKGIHVDSLRDVVRKGGIGILPFYVVDQDEVAFRSTLGRVNGRLGAFANVASYMATAAALATTTAAAAADYIGGAGTAIAATAILSPLALTSYLQYRNGPRLEPGMISSMYEERKNQDALTPGESSRLEAVLDRMADSVTRSPEDEAAVKARWLEVLGAHKNDATERFFSEAAKASASQSGFHWKWPFLDTVDRVCFNLSNLNPKYEKVLTNIELPNPEGGTTMQNFEVGLDVVLYVTVPKPYNALYAVDDAMADFIESMDALVRAYAASATVQTLIAGATTASVGTQQDTSEQSTDIVAAEQELPLLIDYINEQQGVLLDTMGLKVLDAYIERVTLPESYLTQLNERAQALLEADRIIKEASALSDEHALRLRTLETIEKGDVSLTVFSAGEADLAQLVQSSLLGRDRS